jgi:hypothetical protein
VNIKEAQDELNARFVYKADRGERWRILTNDTGAIEGDCEDYSLTLAWMMSDKSKLKFWLNILTFKFVIWNCRSPRNIGHAVMWIRGHGWTDNITKKIVSKSYLKDKGYQLLFPFLGPLAIFKYYISIFTGK